MYACIKSCDTLFEVLNDYSLYSRRRGEVIRWERERREKRERMEVVTKKCGIGIADG